LELEEMLKLAGFERKSWWGWALIMNKLFTLEPLFLTGQH
jgi:hypothetical protein